MSGAHAGVAEIRRSPVYRGARNRFVDRGWPAIGHVYLVEYGEAWLAGFLHRHEAELD